MLCPKSNSKYGQNNCCKEEYVMKDRRITVQQVIENFDIGFGTAQDMLTNKQ